MVFRPETKTEEAPSTSAASTRSESSAPAPATSSAKRKSSRQTQPSAKQHKAAKKSTTNVRTKEKDEWELDCEVCGRRGKNLDDGTPMMCCEMCGKWHHIQCHDKRDRSLGRPKRDWTRIEFFCQRCLAVRHHQQQQQQAHPQQRTAPATNGYGHYQQHYLHGQYQPHPAQQATASYPPQPSWQAQTQYQPKDAYVPGSAGAYSSSTLRSSYPVGGYAVPGYASGASAYGTSAYAPPPGVYASGSSGYPSSGYQPTNYGGTGISFSHYQPAERAFTTSAAGSGASAAAAPSAHYRTNGWSEPGRYQVSCDSNSLRWRLFADE